MDAYLGWSRLAHQADCARPGWEVVEVVDEGDAPGPGAVAVPDPVADVLAALDTKAEDLHASRPDKTTSGYARDWELWGEFHDWLAEQRRHIIYGHSETINHRETSATART